MLPQYPFGHSIGPCCHDVSGELYCRRANIGNLGFPSGTLLSLVSVDMSGPTFSRIVGAHNIHERRPWITQMRAPVACSICWRMAS